MFFMPLRRTVRWCRCLIQWSRFSIQWFQRISLFSDFYIEKNNSTKNSSKIPMINDRRPSVIIVVVIIVVVISGSPCTYRTIRNPAIVNETMSVLRSIRYRFTCTWTYTVGYFGNTYYKCSLRWPLVISLRTQHTVVVIPWALGSALSHLYRFLDWIRQIISELFLH